MSRPDVLVLGGGISGMAFAFASARAGRRTVVLERDAYLGGCLATHQTGSGYWFELGAHTCYNSYVALAEVIEGAGLRSQLLPRAPTKLRFLDGDRVAGGANLGALLRQLDWWEALRSLPRLLRLKKEGLTVADYYGQVAGRRNYARVLGPMLSAVPSQSADAFPAAMLFKARSQRRTDLPRSFTVQGGLRSIPEAVASLPGIAVVRGAEVCRLERLGDGFAAVTAAGERHEGRALLVATGASVAAALLRDVAPALAAELLRIREALVDSVGVVVAAERVAIPVAMFLVPRADTFHSVVTRDSVPDPRWRAFTFHFRPGQTQAARSARIEAVLGVRRGDFVELRERRSVLPSPVLGHETVVAAIDRHLAGSRLGVSGNYFGGLAIEDCVARSRREWQRIAALD